MRSRSIPMLRALQWACLAAEFLSSEPEQVRDLHLQHSGKRFQTGHRRRVHAALNQTDELHRAADLFRKPGLRQFPRLAEVGDPLAKFSLKHGVGLPVLAVEGNAAKLRASYGMSVNRNRRISGIRCSPFAGKFNINLAAVAFS